jgi:hypothetical protein
MYRYLVYFIKFCITGQGLVKFNTGEAGSRWEAAQLELEQCGSTDSAVDFGTISIFATKSNFKVIRKNPLSQNFGPSVFFL